MKIKLLKDIPGYKVGDILKGDEVSPIEQGYNFDLLIKEGWAEEIDDIDIEEIRAEYSPFIFGRIGAGKSGTFSTEEIAWFNSYRIVKAVIEKLNGEMKPYEGDPFIDGFSIKALGAFGCGVSFIGESLNGLHSYSPIPKCKDSKTVEKVISLCEPELKVLFGVK